jgi:hypothetical protein
MQRRRPSQTAPSIVRRLRYASLVVFVTALGFTSTTTGVRADTTLPNWGQQNPSQAPPGRAYASMDFDSRRGRVVLFGGGNQSANFADTWEWDGTAWSTFFTVPSPPSAIGPGMAYDSARGVSVLLDNSSNTWEWNGKTWVRRSTALAPSPRFWTSMVYDSAHGRMVLFGGDGSGGVDLGDTWTYDGVNWTKMSPASSPSPRFGMAMAFDSARGVVVLFGGRAGVQRMADTWEWDGSNWTQRTPANSPLPRLWHSMAYDAQLGQTVMFGGDYIEPFALGPVNDTWVWDGTNWTRDWTAAAPSPRAGQAMAYESGTGRVLAFGGTDELNPGTFPADTWELGAAIVTPAGNPSATFNPTTVSFGTQSAIGMTSAPDAVFVSSSGTGPLLINSIISTGDFAVASSDCPVAPNPLAAGTRCELQVTFTPTVCATGSGNLAFADNGPNGTQSVPLQGGVLAPSCDGDLQLFPSKDITVAATSPSGAVVNFGSPAIADEDGGTPPPVTCNPAPGSTFPIGTSTVTCQVTDGDDATSTVTASFHVTVTDADLALHGVPADITVSTTSQSGAVVTYPLPSALDEDASAPVVSCNPGSGSTFPSGTTVVMCTASDADDSPSTVTATFKVTVNDSDLAFNGVPPNGTVDAIGPPGTAVNYTMPVAVDEDASAPVVTCRPASGSTFPIGTTTVSCTASDADDVPGTVTATFQVTVNDTDLALSGVPANISVDATSAAGASVGYTPPAAIDEDGSAPVVSCDHASGSTFPIGTTTVTCQAGDSDDSPGTVTAAFNVTVRDTDLFLSGPADITVFATNSTGAKVTYPMPTAVDEEGTPVVTCDHASGSVFPVGVMTLVTCQVTDSDDTPSTVSIGFFISVLADLQIATSTSPATAGAHTTVTTTAAVTDLGAVSRKTTISYAVTFTAASGRTSTVAASKGTVTIKPGQTVTRSFAFAVKNSTPRGTYTVTVTASDVTGSVSQISTFVVT